MPPAPICSMISYGPSRAPAGSCILEFSSVYPIYSRRSAGMHHSPTALAVSEVRRQPGYRKPLGCIVDGLADRPGGSGSFVRKTRNTEIGNPLVVVRRGFYGST